MEVCNESTRFDLLTRQLSPSLLFGHILRRFCENLGRPYDKAVYYISLSATKTSAFLILHPLRPGQPINPFYSAMCDRFGVDHVIDGESVDVERTHLRRSANDSGQRQSQRQSLRKECLFHSRHVSIPSLCGSNSKNNGNDNDNGGMQT